MNIPSIITTPLLAEISTDVDALAGIATEARLAELDAANLPSDVDALIVAIDDLSSISSEARLAELDAANLPSDVDDLIATATEARLAELDATNLPSDVDTIKNHPFSLGKAVRKTVTFDGSTGGGEVGPVQVFTVTGVVAVRVIAYCTADLVGATATVSLGIVNDDDAILPATLATDLDTNVIWNDATPGNLIESLSSFGVYVISNGMDIILVVGIADVTAGTLEFVCFYEKVSADGLVVAA